MALWAYSDTQYPRDEAERDRVAADMRLPAGFAAFRAPIHITAENAVDADQISALVDRLILDAGRAGAAALRVTRNHRGLAVDAIRGDGKRRVLIADAAPGAVLFDRFAALSDGAAAIERVDADGETLLALHLPRTACAPVAALAGFPSLSADRVARAVEHERGLILVADPQEAGRATTIRAIGDYHRGTGRAVLSIDSLCREHVSTLGAAFARAEAVAPDVLLIDEIGSAESVRCAVGGAIDRLVVAGVRSKDAMAAMAQIALRKTERFDFASVIRAVVAQRAVQRLCDACKETVQASRSESALLGFDAGMMVCRAVGCAQCRGTGFAGEVAAIEVVEADDALRRLIGGGGDAAILARHAFLNAPNLGAAARELVREGATTPSEAIRISRGDPIAA